jgi:hypothetical protein
MNSFQVYVREGKFSTTFHREKNKSVREDMHAACPKNAAPESRRHCGDVSPWPTRPTGGHGETCCANPPVGRQCGPGFAACNISTYARGKIAKTSGGVAEPLLGRPGRPGLSRRQSPSMPAKGTGRAPGGTRRRTAAFEA